MTTALRHLGVAAALALAALGCLGSGTLNQADCASDAAALSVVEGTMPPARALAECDRVLLDDYLRGGLR